MKKAVVLLMIMLVAPWLPAQGTTAGSWAPMLLYTNGIGGIPNFHDGQMLQVGQRYYMGVRLDRDCVFTGWQQMKKAIEVKTVNYPSGYTVITTNTVISPTGKNFNQPWMSFIMEPVRVVVRDDHPGTSVITEYWGWRANFAAKQK